MRGVGWAWPQVALVFGLILASWGVVALWAASLRRQVRRRTEALNRDREDDILAAQVVQPGFVEPGAGEDAGESSSSSSSESLSSDASESPSSDASEGSDGGV